MTLTRNSHDRMIGGVCAGIAGRFGLDPTLVRLLFVVSFALPGPGLLAYLLMWVLLPWDWEIVEDAGAWAPASVRAQETLAA